MSGHIRIAGAIGAAFTLYAAVILIPLNWGEEPVLTIWMAFALLMMFGLHVFQFVFGRSPFGDDRP